MATKSFLTDEDMAALTESGETVDYPAKAVIVEQNTECSHVYWIIEGVVQIDFARLYNNDVLAYLGAGDLFGDMSYLLGCESSASAVATQPVKVLEVPFATLRSLSDTQPGLAARFYKTLAHTLAQRLRAQNQR